MSHLMRLPFVYAHCLHHNALRRMLHLVRNASNIKCRFLIKMSDTINIRILLVNKITMMV